MISTLDLPHRLQRGRKKSGLSTLSKRRDTLILFQRETKRRNNDQVVRLVPFVWMGEASVEIVRKECCFGKHWTECPEKFQFVVDITAEQADRLQGFAAAAFLAKFIIQFLQFLGQTANVIRLVTTFRSLRRPQGGLVSLVTTFGC